jgi:oxygen-independent coproporphyrinogen III oxidase
MSAIDLNLLLKLHKPTPRYTSYPTAPNWNSLHPAVYVETLKSLINHPLSLYFHIPFCKTMCLYCGCSVILNRKPENEERYVDYLCREMEQVTTYLGKGGLVKQLHFGGGTPTKLAISLFQKLFEKIKTHFTIEDGGEIAIEIDPRTVFEDGGEKLSWLHQLGFNRVSFGVQDTDERVQNAVKRHQSLQMTQQTYQKGRSLGFKGINIDLIYGLPYQTVQSFQTTIDHILHMRPDRISLFSYARVPWLKPHQKAIPDTLLPSMEEKFQIYVDSRHRLIQAGYIAIGMDHFALETDEMAMAYKKKLLQRNFQGYSLKLAENILGFGVSAIGFAHRLYMQNLKDLPSYYHALDHGLLPIHRGKILSHDDHLRKWVIHTLMCDFELDKITFASLFQTEFDDYFKGILEDLELLEKDQLIQHSKDKILVTPLGELFVRNIAMTFDAYQHKSSDQPQFSLSI